MLGKKIKSLWLKIYNLLSIYHINIMTVKPAFMQDIFEVISYIFFYWNLNV